MHDCNQSGKLRWSRTLLALMFVMTLAGCGSSGDDTPKGNVSGKVLIGGAPFVAGSVRFTSVQSVSDAYGAEMKSNGAFLVSEPIPTGSYKVSLSPPPVGPVTGPDGVPRPATAEDMKNNIPPKYASAETSDKIVEVKEGTNDLPIELTP